MKLIFVALFLSLAVIPGSQITQAGEPIFSLKAPTGSKSFSRPELLKHPAIETLTLTDDPAFPGQKRMYSALPVYEIFKGVPIPEGASIIFHCQDGFSAPIDAKKLLNQRATSAIAYLAIERPDDKWPPVPKGAGVAANESTPATYAGPFYLVWKNSAASKINREEWPFQVVEFEVGQPFQANYPHILPDKSLPAHHPVQKGFQVFAQVCFSCHTLNKQGESQMGPDLNLPMNPTEYFQPKALRQLIRNPQSLRQWPTSKMPPFPKEVVSDTELDHLVAYLKHMAHRKRK